MVRANGESLVMFLWDAAGRNRQIGSWTIGRCFETSGGYRVLVRWDFELCTCEGIIDFILGEQFGTPSSSPQSARSFWCKSINLGSQSKWVARHPPANQTDSKGCFPGMETQSQVPKPCILHSLGNPVTELGIVVEPSSGSKKGSGSKRIAQAKACNSLSPGLPLSSGLTRDSPLEPMAQPCSPNEPRWRLYHASSKSTRGLPHIATFIDL